MKILRNCILLVLVLFGALQASAFYDPNLQRWPNRDPIGESGGINLYHFNFNTPIGRTDAEGLQSVTTPAGAEALVIAVGEAEAAEIIGAAAARSAAVRIAEAAAAAAAAAEACRKKKEECDKQWKEAREKCAEELAKPNPVPPYKRPGPGSGSVEDCAKGFVTEECGGSPNHPAPPKKRRNWIFK